MPRERREPTIWFQGRQYFDDRLYIQEVCRTFAKTSGLLGRRIRWSVLTRHNTPPFPPFRCDDFATREEAIAFLGLIEPLTPRISLGGRSPRPVPTLAEHRAWVDAIGARRPYIEPKPRGPGYTAEIYHGKRMELAIRKGDLAWGQSGDSTVSIRNTAAQRLRGRLEPHTTPYVYFSRMASGLEETGRPFPWAVIIYDAAHPLADHFLRTRRDPATVVGSSHFGGADGEGTLSTILVFDKAVLEELGAVSPLYRESWQRLKELSPSRRWLCLPSPLDPEWVREAAASVGVDPPRR